MSVSRSKCFKALRLEFLLPIIAGCLVEMLWHSLVRLGCWFDFAFSSHIRFRTQVLMCRTGTASSCHDMSDLCCLSSPASYRLTTRSGSRLCLLVCV